MATDQDVSGDGDASGADQGHRPSRPDRVAGSLEDQLCFSMYSALNVMTRLYRRRLDGLGLTYPQYLAMLVLWDAAEPVAVGALADQLRLAPNAISPLIDRLKRALVSRNPTPSDRRRVLVALTAAGAALEAQIPSVQCEVSRASGLSDTEIADLRLALNHFIEHAGSSAAGD